MNNTFIDSLNIRTAQTIDDVDSLLQRREALLLKITETKKLLIKLKEEINAINEQLPKEETLIHLQLVSPTITKENPDFLAKATFLFDLFHGRRDVYAQRIMLSNGKAGYTPVCTNFFKEGCPKKTKKENNSKNIINCTTCPNKSFAPLTPEIILKQQLMNSDPDSKYAIGLYTTTDDNTCHFLAIDFDESTWKEDAKAVLIEARKSGFSMAIERSRSGNGAHLWLFLTEPVPAKDLRRLAFYFLDQAAEHGKLKAKLSSYDRIFPGQDKLTENGIGNLIQMPLIRLPSTKGCSVFLDDSFEVYPDQIAYLSSLQRHTKAEISSFLNTVAEKECLNIFNEEELDFLWVRKLPILTNKDFNNTPVLYLSSGITLAKSDLSKKAYLFFLKLTSFSNSEYYQTVNRTGNYHTDIPSTISLLQESKSAILLPRGFENYIISYFKKNKINYTIQDYRIQNTKLEATFKGKLREEQIPIFEKMKTLENGILYASTSFGKTITAIALIAEKKERTLILVNKSDLVDQWIRKLTEFLQVDNKLEKRKGKRKPNSPFGIYSGAKDSATGLVDIATLQTLYSRIQKNDINYDIINKYGMVIVDECHHMAADSFSIVMRELKAKYVFGLTATVKRKDKKEKIVYALLGKPFSSYDPALLALNRHIQQFIQPHFTTSHLPITEKSFIQTNFIEAVNWIIKDKNRNDEIIKDLLNAREANRRILVASSRIEHIKTLSTQIEKKYVKTIILHGALKDNERNQRIEQLNSDDSLKENPIVFGTTQYIKEGSDFPSLDTLFIVTPLSWSENVKQLLGRIARSHKNKMTVEVHDYVDLNIPLFERSYSKRLSTYYKLGYMIKGNSSESKEDCLYSEDNILEALLHSLRNATSRIVISCPFIVPNKNTKALLTATQNIPTQIIRNPTSKEEYKDIENASSALLADYSNIKVNILSHSLPFFITIDRKELWYGNINFMNINPSSDNIGTALHLYDEQLATRLERQELFI